MSNSRRSQTNIATFNIGFNILLQRRSVILFGNQLLSFVDPKKVCKSIVMMSTNQLKLNIFRDKKEALILEYSFNIFLAFGMLCSSEFVSLFIIALQIRKPQSQGFDVSIVKTFIGYFSLKKVSKLLQLRQDSYATNEGLVKKGKNV